jgi:hypothetical protein
MCNHSIRLHRLALCAFMALAAGSAAFGQDAPPYDFAPLPTTTIDPDLGYEAKLDLGNRGSAGDPDGGVAASVGACDLIGASVVPYTRSFAYRGDLLRVTRNGVILSEARMQLKFTGRADLHFSIHRREIDGTYKRFMDDIIILQAEGTGAFKFYTTKLINSGDGVLLPPGFDYAIAFAWGSTAITFAHDGLPIYPLTIEAGSVRGSLALTLPGDQPPVLDNIGAPPTFTGGAYPMELCFIPQPGACCSGGSCVDKLAFQCSGAGSFFHGQRTLCAETPCEFGACCDKCGQCQSGFTPEACQALGGGSHWPGAGCPADPSTLCQRFTGACCSGAACDDTKCEAECIAGGGVYRGDGTDCTPNICQGACCISSFGQCLELEQTTCTQLQGSYKGNGTQCNMLPPGLECGGACCFGTPTGGLTSCRTVTERSSCSYVNPSVIRAYKGDLTSCGVCGSFGGYHKCCLPDGVCIDTTEVACGAALGVYDGGVHCEPGSCTKKACCFTDGTCRLMTADGCSKYGGIEQPGTDCTVNPNLCAGSIPTGACCGTAAGDCTITKRTECEALGKVYGGDYADCTNPVATCPGSGACCRDNGDCFDGFSAVHCLAADGDYQGNSTACFVQPVHCDNRGACCTITGLCLFVDSVTCTDPDVGGVFRGEGVSCAVADACISGACCKGTTCVQRTPAACVSENGVYRGDDTTCEADTCAPRGGCCLVDACAIETELACGTSGGTYLGDNTACPPDSCTPGACCQPNGSCGDGVLSGACAGPGQTFHADLLCTNVQCVPLPTGACCNGNTGICTNNVLQQDCQGAGKRYGGNGSTCATLNPPCTAPGGACCVESTGDCTESVLQANCQAAGQRWGGAGVTCATLNPPCTPPPPTGACCNGTNCSVVTQAQCASGTYKGDNVPCEANTCAPACTAIVSTSPANCAIDARQPFSPGNPGTPQGWNAITLTFDCADTSAIAVGDFSVSTVPSGSTPTVATVAPNGSSLTVNLSGPIAPGVWTCITHTSSGKQVCLGFLPADANSNRTSTPADILDVIDNLNGVRVPPLQPHQCDLDRNNACVPADILTEIDLLNGASGFTAWNGQALPVCPSAP